jgi:hypothetical protein
MKRKLNNILYFAALIMFAIISCSKEGEYNLSETAPLDFKTYYNGLTVTFVSMAEDASNISWDFGDETQETSGDSVVHTYAVIGNYVITMNGTVGGQPYTFHTVLRVDKASVVSLTDGSFDDWDGVTYPDFQLEGKDHVIGGKVDYDANNIYIYLEYDTAGTNGLATLNDCIMDLYMDVDNAASTGFSSSIGAEVLFEGNAPTGWFDYYNFTGASQSDWSWEYYTLDNAIVMGHSEESTNLVRMEFALSREAFGINSDAFAFQLVLNYSDWSGEAGSLAKDNETRIVMRMDKQ